MAVVESLWREDAACLGVPLPWVRTEHASPRDIAAMAQVCDTCTVRRECHEDMMRREDKVGFRAGVVWTNPVGDPARALPGAPLRVCEWCGQAFARTGKRLYCSRGCSQAADRVGSVGRANRRLMLKRMSS
jgi:hypothetical protein